MTSLLPLPLPLPLPLSRDTTVTASILARAFVVRVG